MEYDKLFKPGKPAFYIVVMDDSAFADLYLDLTYTYKEAAIRKVRGKKSTTVSDWYNEVAAALQFPYYFGENWDAFEEVITDLSWIVANAYLLMVSDANLLLSQADPKQFRILMDILADAKYSWRDQAQGIDEDKLVPFHVVFQCSETNVTEFSRRLEETGITFEVLI